MADLSGIFCRVFHIFEKGGQVNGSFYFTAVSSAIPDILAEDGTGAGAYPGNSSAGREAGSAAS